MFRIRDYIEPQAVVLSAPGETRQHFYRRKVLPLEQGGLDDVFARCLRWVLNIDRLATGGGGRVADPRQDGLLVPTGWTMDAQERRARTQAARGQRVQA